MALVLRIVGIYLIVTAVAVGLLLMFTPLIHDGSPEYPLWEILNWFMAAGVVLILAINLRRRIMGLAGGTDASSKLDHLQVNIVYYATVALTILFFWEWFWTLNPASETGDAVTSHLIYFPIVDVLFVVLALSTGRHLFNVLAQAPKN